MSELNIDSTYGVIVIQDMNAVHVDYNYARIFGYRSPEELLTQIDTFLDLIDPSLHSIAKQNYRDIVHGNKVPHGHTFTNIDKNGREFTVFAIDHLIEWKGKPALQVTVMDLSLVEEANRRLRENDLKYKRLVTQSGQGILVHRNFKPLMLNDAWVKMMRAESKEFVLRQDSVLNIVEPCNQEIAVERNRAKMQGLIVENESNIFANICYDGTKRYFNVYDNLIEWDGELAIQVVLEDVTDKVEMEKELAYRASHDQLTNLLNRFSVFEWLKENQTSTNNMCCMLIDIDDFKVINDKHGHLVGDNVIGTFASILKSITDDVGIAGRWGGEEFIVFIPNSTIEHTHQLANSICDSFHKIKFTAEQNYFNATVSIGLSFSDNVKHISIDQLIRQADDCLYQAKSSGKNCVRF